MVQFGPWYLTRAKVRPIPKDKHLASAVQSPLPNRVQIHSSVAGSTNLSIAGRNGAERNGALVPVHLDAIVRPFHLSHDMSPTIDLTSCASSRRFLLALQSFIRSTTFPNEPSVNGIS